jgi:hypothetical protein
MHGHAFVFEVGLLLLEDGLCVGLELSQFAGISFFLFLDLCLVRVVYFFKFIEVSVVDLVEPWTSMCCRLRHLMTNSRGLLYKSRLMRTHTLQFVQ